MNKAKLVFISILGLAMTSMATPMYYASMDVVPDYYFSMANPIYYQFKGVVTESNVADRSLGSEVQYVFVMDFQRFGLQVFVENVNYPEHWYTHYNPLGGSFSSIGDPLFREWAAEFVGGDVVPISEGSAERSIGDFFGNDMLQSGRITSGISTDYGDPVQKGRVSVSNTGSHALDRHFIPDQNTMDTARIPLWHVGQSDFYGVNTNGRGDIVRTQLTLWSISIDNPVPAVPEPSTVALMGLGLVGLFTAYRKSKKA